MKNKTVMLVLLFFMKAPTMFTSWVGTQAVPRPQSSLSGSLKRRALRC